MTGSLQGFLKESLDSSRATLGGEPKVDCGAAGIDGTIEVPPLPTLANVGFVDPPGAVGRFQFAPPSFIQFGRVALHPAPHAGVVRRQTAYERENRRYQRTAQTMISGSKCRHLNIAGRGPVGIAKQPTRLGRAIFATQSIDRHFFREAVNTERVLAALSEKVRTIVEIEPLLETVTETGSSALHIDRVAALVRCEGDFVPAYARGFGAEGLHLRVPANSPLVERLGRDRQPLRGDAAETVRIRKWKTASG